MSVPGAENPDKVKNIVAGQGAREGLRAMYGGMLREKRVRWVQDAEKEEDAGGKWVWKGDGEELLEVRPLSF